MENDPPSTSSPLRLILLFLVLVILPLGIGIYLAPRLIPVPQVGIIRVNYDIFDETAQMFSEQLAHAREDDAVKAVVLIVNSPGGSAAFSEEMYLEVLRAREDLPVVAAVDVLAASGGYYVAAAANEIYAKASSGIGSIGVFGLLPGPVFIDDEFLTTGPFKAFGGTQDAAIRQAERSKFAFLEAVKAGRGERLQVDTAVLSRAELYDGLRSLEMGLIDGIKSNDEAISRAAELAGLVDYDVVELFPVTAGDAAEETEQASQRPPALDLERLWAPPDDYPPGNYFRYVVPRYR